MSLLRVQQYHAHLNYHAVPVGWQWQSPQVDISLRISFSPLHYELLNSPCPYESLQTQVPSPTRGHYLNAHHKNLLGHRMRYGYLNDQHLLYLNVKQRVI